MKRLGEIMDYPSETVGDEDRTDLDKVEGDIEFKDVTFRYGNVPLHWITSALPFRPVKRSRWWAAAAAANPRSPSFCSSIMSRKMARST